MLALNLQQDVSGPHQPAFSRHEREPAGLQSDWADQLGSGLGYNSRQPNHMVTEASTSVPSGSSQPIDQTSPLSLLVPQPKRTKSQRQRRKEKLNRPLPPTPLDQLGQLSAEGTSSPGPGSGTLETQSVSSPLPSSQSSFSSPDKVYSSLQAYVIARASKSEELQRFSEDLSSIPCPTTNSPVSTIIESCRYRIKLEQVLSHMDEISQNVVSDIVKVNEAITKDEANLVAVFGGLLATEDCHSRVLALEGDDAEVFMDAIQQIGHQIPQSKSIQLNTLLIELSKRSTALPDTLFITGVAIVQGRNSFGGTFGDIYRSTYQNKAVALKRLRIFQNSDRGKVYKKFCAEARVWHRLKHRFVLPFLGVDAENFPRQPCMVSPWMVNGTVIHFLKKNPRANVDKLLYEVAQGVSYLHSEGVVHGDLKGVNILIDDGYHAQLADFGLTVLAEATQYNTTDQGGTVRYMAPELLNPAQFGMRYRRTFESDMYAYACLCIELYTRQIPFAHLPTEVLVMNGVIRGERPDRPSSMTDELWKLVTTCWDERPTRRLSADVVVTRLKDILRSSATSSTYGATPRSPRSPRTSPSVTTLATIGQIADDDLSTVHPGTERQPPSHTPRTTRITRRAREDGEDERAYSLQPIRTHADPSRVYHNLREESHSSSVTIHVAQLKGTKSVAAIKKIKIARQTPRALSLLADEFLAMRYLHHANLVNYIDVFKYQEDVWVLMERLTNTISLRKVIDRTSLEPLTKKETFTRTVLRSLFQAVDYLHRHDVCHGYINAENVLFVDKAKNGVPIRLQLCAMISDDDQIATGSKRPAPEIVAETDPTLEGDVWDIGILTLDILGGTQALDWTIPNPFDMLSSSRVHPSESLHDLLSKMLDLVPAKRPTPAELLRHSFLVRSRRSTSEN